MNDRCFNLQNFDYDLKNEDPMFRDCGKDSLYKFLLYKEKASSINFDCDRCAYMKRIYSLLWGFNYNIPDSFQQIQVGDESILMGMDTMNSLWNILKHTLNRYCKGELQKEFKISEVHTKHIGLLIANYDILKRMLISRLSRATFDKFVLLAQLTHTIGNMLLVPKIIEPYIKDGTTFNNSYVISWRHAMTFIIH